ncbi:DUF4377 domain-containing protein [Telluribacter sp. SYSU D00476]|uniref:DUF4377 domain-containing protein n=1 Tax=Telluribacter sp. SYSU D00476 TaxID=2811430 RepID=UPI001FF45ADD|nr:DUF4377 domain-containing protein [Telluribacter sp. SYSU D00476]
MKMKQYLFLLFVIVFAFSCKKDNVDNQIIMMVRDTKASCTGAHGPMECLQVQMGDKVGSQTWEFFYSPIEGFNYEPGYIYTLKVKTEPIKNPPADGSSIKYTLIEEVLKEKV